MKANELMIGDWVLYNETPQQILEISGIDDEVYLETDELVHQSEIQPIPLTPEILEKNGFVEWRDKCYRWEYADGVYINADFTEEEPWAHISNRCYSATPVCRYVHEFQHALRLCEIKKEIVL